MESTSWAMLVMATDGSTNGVFTTPFGVRLHIHENWLYVNDWKAWRERRHHGHSVMEIHHGQLTYLDLQVHAVRGPQDGIYVIATTGAWYRNTFEAMVGCGVYGWAPEVEPFEPSEVGDPRWMGVGQEAALFLRQFVRRFGEELPSGHPFLGEEAWARVWPADTAG